ncbi:hypothetical protein M0802_016656 [Mischocyttarus mexicanus]|nr:hypothetical protein M0802_016656 [Mischocyttarus mexicanus]
MLTYVIKTRADTKRTKQALRTAEMNILRLIDESEEEIRMNTYQEWMLIEWLKQHVTTDQKELDHLEDPQNDSGIAECWPLQRTQPNKTQA